MVMMAEAGRSPSPFSELFTIDSKSGLIHPSLPISPSGLVYEHATKFLVPGLTSSSDTYTHTLNCENTIMAASRSVGKLFLEDGSWGSAFYVAPNILCTAGHVGYVSASALFSADAQVPSLEYLKKIGNGIPFLPIGKDWVFQRKLAERNANRLDVDPIEPHDPLKGSIAQCDFAFLKLDGAATTTEYLLPAYVGGREIAVVGYPGIYDDNVVKLKKVGHPSIWAAFNNALGSKHVAPGEVLGSNTRMLAHNSSTLKGSSGSPVLTFTQNDCHFLAIHMEGWGDVNWNLSVSATHPVFVAAYKEFVYPELPANAQAQLAPLYRP